MRRVECLYRFRHFDEEVRSRPGAGLVTGDCETSSSSPDVPALWRRCRIERGVISLQRGPRHNDVIYLSLSGRDRTHFRKRGLNRIRYMVHPISRSRQLGSRVGSNWEIGNWPNLPTRHSQRIRTISFLNPNLWGIVVDLGSLTA
jgi:hypothetical protein